MGINIEVPYIDYGVSGTELNRSILRRSIDFLSSKSGHFVKGVTLESANETSFSEIVGHTSFVEDFNSAPDKLRVAFSIYQGGSYTRINNFLRGNKGLVRETEERGKEGELEYKIEDEIDALDLLIEGQKPLEEDIVLYRAVGSDSEGLLTSTVDKEHKVANLSGKLMELGSLNDEEIDDIDKLIGKTYHSDGYMSSSFSLPRGHAFRDMDTIMVIKVPKGTSILGPVTNLVGKKSGSGEYEVLIGRDYDIKIVGVEHIGEKTYIYSELQPRKLELTEKPLDELDISMPKNVEDYKHSSYSEVQKDIIIDAKKRELYFHVKEKINSINEKLKIVHYNITRKIKPIQSTFCLNVDLSKLERIIETVNDIDSLFDTDKLSLEQIQYLSKISLEKLNEVDSKINGLQEELEKSFCSEVYKRVFIDMKANDIREKEKEISKIKDSKDTFMEKLFGKEELKELQIKQIEDEIEKIKAKEIPTKNNIIEVLDEIYKYMSEHGHVRELDADVKILKEELFSTIESKKERDICEKIEDIDKSVTKEIPEPKETKLFDIKKEIKKIKEEKKEDASKDNTSKSPSNSSQLEIISDLDYIKSQINHSLEENESLQNGYSVDNTIGLGSL